MKSYSSNQSNSRNHNAYIEFHFENSLRKYYVKQQTKQMIKSQSKNKYKWQHFNKIINNENKPSKLLNSKEIKIYENYKVKTKQFENKLIMRNSQIVGMNRSENITVLKDHTNQIHDEDKIQEEQRQKYIQQNQQQQKISQVNTENSMKNQDIQQSTTQQKEQFYPTMSPNIKKSANQTIKHSSISNNIQCIDGRIFLESTFYKYSISIRLLSKIINSFSKQIVPQNTMDDIMNRIIRNKPHLCQSHTLAEITKIVTSLL